MSTEPLRLTPAPMEQLRGELGIRRRRWPLIAAAVITPLTAGSADGRPAFDRTKTDAQFSCLVGVALVERPVKRVLRSRFSFLLSLLSRQIPSGSP